MKISQIESFKVGDSIRGFFICDKKINKNTRLGDPYIDLLIKDSSGVIRCKIWSNVDFYNSKIQEGSPIAVKGNIISYNGQLEIDIKHINTIVKDEYNLYGFDRKLIIKSFNKNIQSIWNDLESNISKIPKPLNKLISKIYRKNKEKISIIPHYDNSYNLKHGYINKINNVLTINSKLSSIYNNLDISKILTGIFVKDLGCIDYFNDDMTFSISDKSKYLNLDILGINLLNSFCADIEINEDVKLYLNHIISNKIEYHDLESEYIDMIFKIDSKFNNNLESL